MNRRAVLQSLIARARHDAEQYALLDSGLDKAIKDFEKFLPYPFIWYVYRSRFKMRKKELDTGSGLRYHVR